MKPFALTLIAAAATLFFSGCQKSEKAAIEEFKAEVTALKTWSDSKDKEVAANPTASMTLISEMSAKMKAIKTSDLPADLKEAWNGMLSGVDKMTVTMAELPKDPAQMQEFMTKKMQENPKFAVEFQAKMEAIGKEMEGHTNKMKEVAKKYGIEGLDKLGKK